MSDCIAFQVETSRVLEILSKQIYDTPLALLRENVQNCYDAIRMRFAADGQLKEGGEIRLQVSPHQISISDNGIGMTETVLRENFWKAGSSGKHSLEARTAGVVGTFGIGAMANFGVCSKLIVETRSAGMPTMLRSIAEKEKLTIGTDCISLESVTPSFECGTTVTAFIAPGNGISPEQAEQYLRPYVGILDIPVYINEKLISRGDFKTYLNLNSRSFTSIRSAQGSDGLAAGEFKISADHNGQLLVSISNLTLGGQPLSGEIILLQNGGPLMGFRSSFGLAPMSCHSFFQFGGIVNLSILQPTAGREALSRESIEQVSRIIALADRIAAEALANSDWANRNNDFLNWITSHNRYELASKLTVKVFPNDLEIELGKLQKLIEDKPSLYYGGTDPQIIATFSNESAFLMQLAAGSPRRNVQQHYLSSILGIKAAPDSAQILQVFKPSQLEMREGALILRVGAVLRDDYLMPEIQVNLATISHGVTILARKSGDIVELFIARESAALAPLYQCYDNAYEHFTQFVKDFVRIQIYPRIQEYIPSATRDGVDALHRILQRNRELYRYEEGEQGELEGILGEYLIGDLSLPQVISAAALQVQSQSQKVSADQVDTVENVLSDVIGSPVQAPAAPGSEFLPQPPIIRDGIVSDMKILATTTKYPQLNNFNMFLGLSDRLMDMQSDFFRFPHTTRLVWAGHRIIYIFTEATKRYSLYYDIELKNSLDEAKSGGAMFPTTTIITGKRIFIPVPDVLTEEFKVAGGSKEFFVRFDILTNDRT